MTIELTFIIPIAPAHHTRKITELGQVGTVERGYVGSVCHRTRTFQLRRIEDNILSYIINLFCKYFNAYHLINYQLINFCFYRE